jgi:hypothetical protein
MDAPHKQKLAIKDIGIHFMAELACRSIICVALYKEVCDSIMHSYQPIPRRTGSGTDVGTGLHTFEQTSQINDAVLPDHTKSEVIK